MTTYGDIRTEFKAILNRRDCTDALADGFLQSALSRAQRVIRVPSMEQGSVVTINDTTYFDNGYLTIPSDYVKLRALTWTGGDGTERVLTKRSLDEVLWQVTNGVQGSCCYFARRGVGWVLGPPPLDSETVRIDYWSEFAEMSDPADETIIADVAKDLLLYGGLSYACDKWNDKRGDRFEARFTQVLSDLQEHADTDELTEASVAPAFLYPED